jgi:uncharacterized protein YjiS (DUF1127 family)
MNEFKTPNHEDIKSALDAARRERAIAFAALARKVVGALRTLAEAYREARQQEALYAELSRMDERQLRDIGLTRADIPAVVAGLKGREGTRETDRESSVPSPVASERLAA